jgi:hypothetical protein
MGRREDSRYIKPARMEALWETDCKDAGRHPIEYVTADILRQRKVRATVEPVACGSSPGWEPKSRRVFDNRTEDCVN